MSLRRTWLSLLVGMVLGCGGGGGATKVEPGEPQTAREKQYAEAEAKGELDDGNASKWGKWRYTGDRKDCFFVVGRRCFKTENAACQASRCKAPLTCQTTGAGPATVRCGK